MPFCILCAYSVPLLKVSGFFKAVTTRHFPQLGKSGPG